MSGTVRRFEWASSDGLMNEGKAIRCMRCSALSRLLEKALGFGGALVFETLGLYIDYVIQLENWTYLRHKVGLKTSCLRYEHAEV